MDREALGDVAETLLDYVEHGTTYQGERITTIPSAAYTDPEQWQREVALIFKRVPLVLATTAELRQPGDYKAMEAMGLPLLLTRGKDGIVRLFLNVCAHRGAPVAAEGHGSCSRFVCQYHSWTYGTDGRLIGVADRAKFGDIDKTSRGLRELPCAEQAGLIFGVLTPGLPLDVPGFFGSALDDVAAAGFADWAYLGSRTITGANWKIAFDGYLEGYHFAQLHPETIHPRTLSNITHYEAFGPHLRIGFPQTQIGEKLAEVPRAQWGERENHGYDFVRILFPSVSLFIAPEITQLAQLFPGPTPDKNITVLSFFRREGPKDETDAAGIEGMMDWLRDVVHDEDYLIGNQIQKGLQSGAHDTIVLGRNERGNQYFHQWVDWYLKDDPGAPKPVL
jgi:phenylpropionate dioxygenase-like ring-hydroxylating dioxygenase large terminal subunit